MVSNNKRKSESVCVKAESAQFIIMLKGMRYIAALARIIAHIGNLSNIVPSTNVLDHVGLLPRAESFQQAKAASREAS